MIILYCAVAALDPRLSIPQTCKANRDVVLHTRIHYDLGEYTRVRSMGRACITRGRPILRRAVFHGALETHVAWPVKYAVEMMQGQI